MSSSSTKPTIILVHGLWHSPAAWNKVIPRLEDRGYNCIAAALVSIGDEAITKSWRDDVEIVTQLVTEQVEQGRDVVIVGHSYGTGVACKAIGEPLLKRVRESQGLTGGICGLVLIAASNLLPCKRDEAPRTFVTNPAPEMRPHFWNVSEDEMTFEARTPEKVFYNDLPADEAAEWSRLLRPGHYQGVMRVAERTWMQLPKVYYMLPEKDNAILTALQEERVKDLLEVDAPLEVKRIESSHSPMLSRPDEVVDFIELACH